ncbi:MAG: hypothetical protein ACOC80_15980 [Petrotogales bacterium]
MSDAIGYFKIVILATLFYSFAITGIAYSLPDDTLRYIEPFDNSTGQIATFEEVTGEVQQNLNQQTQLPIIELGALVFYSGNLIVDLLANFVFAVPQMIGFLVAAVGLIFGGVDIVLLGLVQSLFAVVVVFLYIMSIIQLITGLYSGRVL